MNNNLFNFNNKVTRGSVWVVDLDPVVGHEQAKSRPCVVVSVDSYNNGKSQLVVVVPCTSKFKPLSWLVEINPPEGGVTRKSYIITNQLRTVSPERFTGDCLGFVQSSTLIKIEQRLRILLNL